MSSKFGGDTAIRGNGGYIGNKGRLINERVAVVESSMTREQFQKNRGAMSKYIASKKKAWKQEAIAYNVEGDTFIF